MFGIAAAVKWAMILGLVVTSVGTAWGVVNHIQKSAVIAAQRDALIELAKRQAQTVEQKNKTDAIMRALPDDRVRLCAIQGPESPCCTQDKECQEPKP